VTDQALTVRIESGDGWPVAGAIFTLTDLSGQQAGIAVADEQGDVRLDSPAPGPYTAIFTAPGFSPSATAVVVPNGRPAELGTVRLDRIATETTLPEPGVWTIDPMHTTVGITAQHAGISSVRGRFTEFGGSLMIGSPAETSTVTATIQAESVDTANKMRDDHLRSPDFLNIAEHPTITYRGVGMTPAGPDQWTVRGDLTLCGQTRPVPLDLRYLGVDTDPFGVVRAGFSATTQLRRQDFRISFAQTLATGIAMVGSTVRITLDVEAVQGDTLPF
jgi:polyisoprenoid-binding protein YceI